MVIEGVSGGGRAWTIVRGQAGFLTLLPLRATRASRSPPFCLHLPKIRKKFCLFCRLANVWEHYWILYHKTNKDASTVLCSVVKHLGSVEALKKWGKKLTCVSCFPYTSFVLYHFLRALQQNRAQSGLLYLLSIICDPPYKNMSYPQFLYSFRQRANARNVSFRISLQWPIYIVNSADKTKLSWERCLPWKLVDSWIVNLYTLTSIGNRDCFNWNP